MFSPDIKHKLNQVPHLCPALGPENCSKVVGYLVIYRVCFAMFAFFFIMALITFKVQSSRDPRANIHNGLVRFQTTVRNTHSKFKGVFIIFHCLLYTIRFSYLENEHAPKPVG